MKRLLVLVPAVLFSLPAFAQTAPEGSYRDLWCGLAFGTAAQGVPYTPEQLSAAQAAGASATEEQKGILAQQVMVEQFTTGGQGLVDKATTASKGAGFTDESFGKVRSELEPKVTEQVSGTGAQPEFTFEECSGLLPASAAAATPSTDATTTTTTDAMAPASDSTTMTTTTTTDSAAPASDATATTTTAQ
jgi:hypothetical protein